MNNQIIDIDADEYNFDKRKKKRKNIKHSYENALEDYELEDLILKTEIYGKEDLRFRNRILVYMVGKCGLRVSEAIQFRKSWLHKTDDGYKIRIPKIDDDIFFIIGRIPKDKIIANKRAIKIDQDIRDITKWEPKSEKGARDIDIFDEKIAGQIDGFINSNPNGLQISRIQAYRIIQGIGKLINKNELHPHSLRSTFANYLVMLGVSASTLQYYMGWSKLQTSENYIKATPISARKDLMNKLKNKDGNKNNIQ